MSSKSTKNTKPGASTIVIAPPPARTFQNIPSARIPLTQISNPSHYEWTINAPQGHELDELQLDIEMTLTTTSSLATMSNLIKALRVVNTDTAAPSSVGAPPTQATVALVDGNSIGMAAIISQALREYARPSAAPLSTVIVRDANAGTTATAYYSNWRLHTPFPGKSFKVILDLNSISSVYTSATVVAASVTLVDRWVPAHQAQKYTLLAQSFPTVAKIAFQGVYKGAFCNANEFEANSNGITLGSDLTPEQIFRNEAVSNDDLNNLGAAGTAMTGVDTASIKDPHTAANVAVLIGRFLQASLMKAVFSSSQSPVVVLFGMQDPTSMVING